MTTAFAWNASHPVHAETGHIERPERLEAIRERLLTSSLWERLVHRQPLPVDWEIVRLVHRRPYIERLQQAAAHAPLRLDVDTYLQPGSLEAALEAVGALLAVTQAVVEGQVTNGFAAVRPLVIMLHRIRQWAFACFRTWLSLRAGPSKPLALNA